MGIYQDPRSVSSDSVGLLMHVVFPPWVEAQVVDYYSTDRLLHIDGDRCATGSKVFCRGGYVFRCRYLFPPPVSPSSQMLISSFSYSYFFQVCDVVCRVLEDISCF